jgi:hypothetical protein
LIGERGGSTATFEEGQDLIEAQKIHWREAIRTDILETLDVAGEWHADDLITLGVPADCKNVIGAAVGALVNRGLIEETGERRKSTAPESHGRKSNVYRLTAKGRQKLRRVHQACHGEEVGGVDNPQESSALSTAESRGSSRGSGVVPRPAPNPAAAATSGKGADTLGGDGSPAVTALPTLFELDESPTPVRSHYEDAA